MFRHFYALGKRVRRVIGQDRHFDLAKHRPIVQLSRHQMYARSRNFVFRVNGVLVGMEALIFGEQRRVDVEHPSVPLLHEIDGQYPHISGERDIMCSSFGNLRVHYGIMGRAVETHMRFCEGRNTFHCSDF